MPDSRKIHKKPVPYLGGIAISFSFIITFFAFYSAGALSGWSKKQNGFMIALLILIPLGLLDDIKNVRPVTKLLVQILVALILVKFGFIFDRITNPVGGSIFFPVWVSYFISILWIIGIINAINLLDGLDGLAAGVLSIASFFILLISLIVNNFSIAYISVILLGAMVGFLIFNFPPAKIFMGDTGSMFLGLVFSLMAIDGYRKSTVAINLLVPIVLLAIPIMDTLLVIVRRVSKKKNIFKADKEHIHHRLLNLGIPYEKVLILIYLFCFYLGLISLVSIWVPKEITFILLLIVGINILIGLYILRLIEKHIRKNI